jgi:hypothetical protein
MQGTYRCLRGFGPIFAVSLALSLFPTLAARASTGGFVTGVLPPPPPGSTTTFNAASEPAIRSDPAGNFYISSENSIGSGTDAWRSSNGGVSYVSLPQPNSISSVSGTTGLAPGGGDTDLATATAKDPSGNYNLYVASLTVGSVTVSLSQDRGSSWTNDALSATVPADDREWIAAYGASTYYLSYHNIASGNQIVVNEGSASSGTPVSVQTYSAITDPQILAGDTLGNELGNIAVDPKTGDVYQVFVGCPPGVQGVVNCQALNVAYMAVGTPTGVTAGGLPLLSFTDHVIYTDPHPSQGLDNNFPNVAVDRAGNVYASWSNDRAVFVADSTDHGSTWTKPVKVNSGSATTAIYPWLAAGSAGKVDLVYYGTPAQENFQTCSTSSPSDPCQTEPWYVFMAQNLKVLSGGSWTQSKVTPVVHYGGVCQGGISCSSSGNDNRDLFDDFGVAADPLTGFASIAYSDDQHSDIVGTADSGLCASSDTNQIQCDHTDFATQISGKGI